MPFFLSIRKEKGTGECAANAGRHFHMIGDQVFSSVYMCVQVWQFKINIGLHYQTKSKNESVLTGYFNSVIIKT